MAATKKLHFTFCILSFFLFTFFNLYSPVSLRAEEGLPRWIFTTGANVISSPAVDINGTIFIGSHDEKVYAINADGTLKWVFEQPTGGVVSSPAIGTDGTIYVGSYDYYFYAIRPDGTQKWAFRTGGFITSSPAIGSDGTIYVGSGGYGIDFKLYAFKPDGTIKWTFDCAVTWSSPAIGLDGTVYVGSTDGNLYAVNPDGTQKWKFTAGDFIYASPAIGYDGTIFVGANNGKLFAINPNGTKKWEYGTGKSQLNSYFSPTIGPDGTIYVGSEYPDNLLHAVNPDGTQKWTFDTGEIYLSTPAIDANGTIYVGSRNRNLYAINPDGTQKWSFLTGDYVHSSPVIGPDGTIYIGSYDNKLYAIDGASGGLADTPWPMFRNNFHHTGCPDSDGDGMFDNWEKRYFMGLSEEGSGDFDGDGLTNLAEFRNLTNPVDTDSDDDGMPDGWEVVNGLNPLENDADEDPDGDGLSNHDEFLNGFDPNIQAPQIQFSVEPGSGYAPLAVSFQATSTSAVTSWNWDFGDGTTSTLQNPGHNYPQPGTYSIILTAVGPGGSDTFSVVLIVENPPPVADAGSDQFVAEGTLVVLNGSNSSDPNSDITGYQWIQLDGPSVSIADADTVQASFTSPDVGPGGGVLTFQLTVTDSGGLTSTDICKITVSWVNLPPTADAGPDQTVDEGVEVALSGLNSYDPDDGIDTYEWIQTSGYPVTLSDPAADFPTFTTPDVDPSGEALTFRLTVTDKGGLTSEDTCIVNVTWVNLPPTAAAGPDQTVTEGSQVILSGGESTDADDGIGSFEWIQTVGTPVVLSDPAAAYPSFTAPDVGPEGEALTFQLTVTDEGGLKSTDSCVINVSWSNLPPTADAGPDQVAIEGAQVILNGFGSSDPDDGIGAYQWTQTVGTPVSLSDPVSVYPSFTAPDVGPEGEALTFQLTVTDKGGLKSVDTCVINVSWSNLPPTADAGPDQIAIEGAQVILNGFGSSDPDDGIGAYQWTQTVGTPVSLSDPAAVYPSFFAPDVGPGGEALTFQLTVADKGGLTSTDTCIVNVSWSNLPPTADAGPDQTVSEGTQVILNGFGSSDPDDGIAHYQWTQLAGTSVRLSDPAAAYPTFTSPDVGSNGSALIFQLTVTDTGGLTSSDNCIVNVSWNNLPPTADAGPDQTVSEGTQVILSGVESFDPDDGIAAYQWVQTSGTSVVLNDTAAVYPSFTAPDVSTGGDVLTFQLMVTDGGGLKATDMCSVTVSWNNLPPTADAGPDQTVNEKVQVILSGGGSFDPDDGIKHYQWIQTFGPPVMLSDPSAAYPTFIAPGVDSEGEILRFQLTVTDAGGLTSTDMCIVTVSWVNLPPVADAGPDQTAGEGVSVLLGGSNSYDADDGISDYQWSQIDGPPVIITGDGTDRAMITTPDVSAAGIVLRFRLKVTDGHGLTDVDDMLVNVTWSNEPPYADAGPNQTVSASDTIILDASNSHDTDGIASYAWRQISGPIVALSDPGAVNPTIALTGIQLVGASLVFELTVTDTEGLRAVDTVIVNVASDNRPPIANAGLMKNVQPNADVMLDGLNSTDPDDGIASYQWKQLSGPPVILTQPGTSRSRFIAPEVDNGGASLTFELTVSDYSGLQDSETVIVNVVKTNHPPTAVAGGLQSVASDQIVALDGTGSSDSDGYISVFRWTQVKGQPVFLSDPSSPNPSFSVPDSLIGCAALEFELMVTDNLGLSSSDMALVNICDHYLPPMADAGADIVAEEGSTVTLNGSQSFSRGYEIVSYEWKQISGPQVVLSHPTASQTTFIAPAVEAYITEMIFRLRVEDSGGQCDLSTVIVSVRDNGLLYVPLNAIAVEALNGRQLFISSDDSTSLVSLKVIDPQDIPDPNNRPDNLMYGLLDFQIKVSRPGDPAFVTVWLPEPAPLGYQWFKWDDKSGWRKAGLDVEFNQTRDKVTFKLVDGGIDDADLRANGLIVDPSGIGTSPPVAINTSGGGGGGGCFIHTTESGFFKTSPARGLKSLFGAFMGWMGFDDLFSPDES